MVYHRIERRPSILSCHSFDALFVSKVSPRRANDHGDRSWDPHDHQRFLFGLSNLIHTWLTYDKTKNSRNAYIPHLSGI